MTEYLMLIVAAALLVFGLLLLLAPGALERLEQALNSPVGGRTLMSLRAGIPRERDIENVLNRPVLGRAIYWDQWIRRRPRSVGVLLLAAAAAFMAAAAG